MKTEDITLSTNEKVALVGNFATMLSAGIPLLDTVDSLLEGTKNNPRKILQTLREDISQGKHISTSFMKFPKVFDRVTIQILRASEEAGTLEVTLRDIHNDIKKEAEFSDKVKSALIYPLFITGVFFLVLVLMITFVIPRIATVFDRLHVVLPLPTQILIAVSHFVLTYRITTLVLLSTSVVFIVILFKKKQAMLISLLASLPLISDLIRKIDLTRFSRSLYLLLQAGIPIPTALELAQDTVSASDLKNVIAYCHELVMGGKKFSDGLTSAKNIVPNIFIKITEAGEKSGTLDKAMLDVSEHFDYEVTSQLKTITALIEPIMLVLVGVLIGGMMLAIIAPIYNLISQIHNQ